MLTAFSTASNLFEMSRLGKGKRSSYKAYLYLEDLAFSFPSTTK